LTSKGWQLLEFATTHNLRTMVMSQTCVSAVFFSQKKRKRSSAKNSLRPTLFGVSQLQRLLISFLVFYVQLIQIYQTRTLRRRFILLSRLTHTSNQGQIKRGILHLTHLHRNGTYWTGFARMHKCIFPTKFLRQCPKFSSITNQKWWKSFNKIIFKTFNFF